jgi:hypothetical protein
MLATQEAKIRRIEVRGSRFKASPGQIVLKTQEPRILLLLRRALGSSLWLRKDQ